MRCDTLDTLFDLWRHIEGFNEVSDGFGCDFLVGAGELLESLIGVGETD